EPVTSEDMAVCFTQNQWASLDSAQRALCREVMLGNYANIDSLLERGEAPGDPNPWEAEVLRGNCTVTWEDPPTFFPFGELHAASKCQMGIQTGSLTRGFTFKAQVLRQVW
ncbi:hypothetical protein FD755_005412, partial [Muntiacus reevesi]